MVNILLWLAGVPLLLLIALAGVIMGMRRSKGRPNDELVGAGESSERVTSGTAAHKGEGATDLGPDPTRGDDRP